MEFTEIGEFSSREQADRAAHVLLSAGIESNVHTTGSIFLLRVPDDVAYAAMQVLADSLGDIATSAESSPSACPCGSFETRQLPPYALFGLVSIFAVFLLLTFIPYSEIAFVLLILGWLPLMWLTRFFGKTRCRACGWLYSATSKGHKEG